MRLIADLLKSSGRVSSPFFLLDVALVGVLLLCLRQTRVWGRRWLVAAVLGCWFISTPIGSRLLTAPLVRTATRIESPEQAGGAKVIVVLGGGTQPHVADGFGIDDLGESALRVIEGARLYHLLDHPTVIVSGGPTAEHLVHPRPEAEAFKRVIMELGVPADRVVIEDRSKTTHHEALLLKDMLASMKVDRFVLVTAPAHMPRSLAIFRAVGLNPVPSSARERSERETPPRFFLPDLESLKLSDGAIYEYAAWVYYKLQGWV